MNFLVSKNLLRETSTVPSSPLVLQDGDVLVRVEKFAFTANNITYAAMADDFGYWEFFPTEQAEQGRVPVWGMGVIVASRCQDLLAPRRIYGYFPMSHYVIMRPTAVTQTDFIDDTPHRRELPAIYNQYSFCDEDPFHSPRTEESMMVLRPLFSTSWLLSDFLRHPSNNASNGESFFGADTCIISSASSKTSIGLAFLLFQHNQQKSSSGEKSIRVVGLTSPGNRAFVESLQIYDQVILYDQLETGLDASQSCCFVDMAGNTGLTARLHLHLRDNLKSSNQVGFSHFGQGGETPEALPGARPEFFFAPSWADQRIQEVGGGDGVGNASRRGLKLLLHQILLDYQLFVNWSLGTVNHKLEEGKGKQWLHMQHFYGPDQVSKGYADCLDGKIQPKTAVIMSLWDSPHNQQTAISKL